MNLLRCFLSAKDVAPVRRRVFGRCERLERRDLMAANLTATFDGWNLTIEGTPQADTIVVRQKNGKISVDSLQINTSSGRVSSIDAGSVWKIAVNGLGGDDVINLHSGAVSGQQSITAWAEVYGGKGNDRISGTSAADRLYGDAGDDRLWGYNGDDWIEGGSGGDRLYGGNHNDTIQGEKGDDRLYGENGEDRLYGGDDDDLLSGGKAIDQLYGGAGFDDYEDVFDLKKPAVGGARATDVNQLSSPTCATLASLAEAVEQGWNVDKAIKYRGDGKYDVTLYNHGKKTVVTVTFDGAWNDYDPQPVNADGTVADRFWPVVMQRARLQMLGVKTSAYDSELTEKQWDKLHDKTDGRLFNKADALANITGKSVKNYGIGAADPEKLRNLLKDDRMIVAGTYGDDKKKNLGDSGLVSNHAYGVLNVYQKAGKWMVKLYNPWGNDGGKQSGAADEGVLDVAWTVFKKHFQDYAVA